MHILSSSFQTKSKAGFQIPARSTDGSIHPVDRWYQRNNNSYFLPGNAIHQEMAAIIRLAPGKMTQKREKTKNSN